MKCKDFVIGIAFPPALLATLVGLAACGHAGVNPPGVSEVPVRELQVPAGDVSLYVRIVGDPTAGNVLVAVNGGPGQSSHYMASLERLASAEFAVVTYDQRGTGRSTEPADGYGLLEYVADLEAVREAVGVERVHVLGHSWGGIVTMRYATVHSQRVRSLILVGSGPPNWQAVQAGQASLGQRIGALQQQGIIPPTLPSGGAELVQAILPAYFSNPYFEIPDELEETTFSEAANQQTMSSLGEWDLTREIAQLDHPVLLLWGEDDPFGLPMAQAIKDALTAARVEFLVLKGCGHYWQECPGEFFPPVRAFLGLPSAP